VSSKWRHIVVVAAVALTACEPSIPEQYIQPGDMEDIIYDYFLSQGMSYQRSTGGPTLQDYRKELYLDALLKKHGVSRADFDSSLVYYYTRADRFVKITRRVQERMAEDALEQGASLGEVERFTTSLTGDTADVWESSRMFAFVPNTPYDRMQFSLRADTAYRKGDTFQLSFNSDFFFESGMKDAMAYMAVVLTNDSVIATNTHFSTNGRMNVRLSLPEDKTIKELKGFIHLGPGNDKPGASARRLIVSQIRLLRMHRQVEEEQNGNGPANRNTPFGSTNSGPASGNSGPASGNSGPASGITPSGSMNSGAANGNSGVANGGSRPMRVIARDRIEENGKPATVTR